MSRSYKKTPIWTDQSSSKNSKRAKFVKKTFNHNIRQKEKVDFPIKSNQHKKMNQSWDIRDWCCLETKQQAIDRWDQALAEGDTYYKDKYRTKEKFLYHCWYKYHRRK